MVGLPGRLELSTGLPVHSALSAAVLMLLIDEGRRQGVEGQIEPYQRKLMMNGCSGPHSNQDLESYSQSATGRGSGAVAGGANPSHG